MNKLFLFWALNIVLRYYLKTTFTLPVTKQYILYEYLIRLIKFCKDMIVIATSNFNNYNINNIWYNILRNSVYTNNNICTNVIEIIL